MNIRFLSMKQLLYKSFLLITVTLFFVAGTEFSSFIAYAEENYTFLNKWGVQGIGKGEFIFPQVIGTDQSNNLYVLDNTGRVQKFDSNGAFMKTIITQGPPRPVDGALDSIGNIYVLSNIVYGNPDNINGTISKFDSNGTFIKEWGSQGTGQGQFNQPLEVEVSSSGNVYVADSWNHRIQKFDSNGIFIKEWGTGGTGKGEFNIIHGLALDSLSNVYVADTKYTFPGNDRIQKFDSNGTFIKEWGASGEGNGEFHHPMAITVDSLGNNYVADTLNHRIQKFDSNGTFITSWGSLCRALDRYVQVNSSQFNNSTSGCIDADGPGPQGKGDGQFQIPVSVAVDSNGNVYVSDFTSRIQKFRSQ
jgi:tripartite motif-containing protein 71